MENEEKEEFDLDFDFDEAVLASNEVGEETQIQEQGREEGGEEAGGGENTNTHDSSNTATETNTSQTETTTDTSDQESKANFLPLAKLAVENGFIDAFDEKNYDGSLEGFIQMMQESRSKAIDSGINEYKTTITSFRQRIENALEGGVQEKDIIDHFKTVKDLEKIDKTKLSENDEQLRALYTMYYKAKTDFSDEKITKMINKKLELVDTDDASEIYDEYNKWLVEKEKKMIADAEAEDQKVEEQQKNTLASVNKYIEEEKEFLGVKSTPILKEKLKKEFQTIKGKDGQDVLPVVATRMKNPLEFDIAIRVIHAMGLLNIDDKGKWVPDMSKLTPSVKSKVTAEMEKEFGQGKEIRTGKAFDINNLGTTDKEKAKELEKYLDEHF